MRRKRFEVQQLQLKKKKKKNLFYALKGEWSKISNKLYKTLRFEIEYYIYIFCLLISIVWFKESVFFQLHSMGANEFYTRKYPWKR